MNRCAVRVRVWVLAVAGIMGAFAGFAPPALAGAFCFHRISLSSSAYSVQEGQPVTITVTDNQSASFADCAAATVNYGTSNGTAHAPGDYTSTSGTLTFAGTATGTGTATVTHTFQVPTVDNGVQEGDLTFTVSLSGAASGVGNIATITPTSMATVTIHDIDPPPPPAARAPSATTTAAGAIGHSTATLNGTVNPNGAATTYHFDYGATAAYGQSTASQSAGAGSMAVAVSASLSGLAPGTTYHYRVVATSGGGTSTGADATFTTVALPPSATIASPPDGQKYVQGKAVRTRFICAEGQGGPGLQSCTDSRGIAGSASGADLVGSGRLDTSRLGRHTYTVTARSRDGQSRVTQIAYTVVRAAMVAPHLRVLRISAVAEDRSRCGAELNVASQASANPSSCRAGIVTLSGTVDPRANGQELTIVVRARFAGRSYTLRATTRVSRGRFTFRITLPGRQTDRGAGLASGGDRWNYRISLAAGPGLQSATVSGHFTLEVEHK